MDDVIKLNSELSEIRHTLKAAEGDRDSFAEKYEASEAKVKELEANLSELTEKFEEASKELEEAQAKIAEAEEAEKTAERDSFLDTAMDDKKITKAQRDIFSKMWDAGNSDDVRTLIDTLEDGHAFAEEEEVEDPKTEPKTLNEPVEGDRIDQNRLYEMAEEAVAAEKYESFDKALDALRSEYYGRIDLTG